MFWAWVQGGLPSDIYYPGSHPGTQDMKRSRIVQRMRTAYMQKGCPASDHLDSGHFGPWKESGGNVIVANTTQFQVGGFNGNIFTTGDRAMTSYTINNTIGLSSLLGQTTWGPAVGMQAGAWDRLSGSMHNIRQTFTWSEPNPCGR